MVPMGGIMKTLIFVLVGAAAIGVISVVSLVYVGIWSIGEGFSLDRSKNASESSVGRGMRLVANDEYRRRTCDALISEAEENAFAFDQKYHQIPLRMRGVISAINSHPINGAAIVSIEGGNEYLNIDDCDLTLSGEINNAAKLRTGQEQTFFCVGSAKGIVSVELYSCQTTADRAAGYRHQIQRE